MQEDLELWGMIRVPQPNLFVAVQTVVQYSILAVGRYYCPHTCEDNNNNNTCVPLPDPGPPRTNTTSFLCLALSNIVTCLNSRCILVVGPRRTQFPLTAPGRSRKRSATGSTRSLLSPGTTRKKIINAAVFARNGTVDQSPITVNQSISNLPSPTPVVRGRPIGDLGPIIVRTRATINTVVLLLCKD